MIVKEAQRFLSTSMKLVVLPELLDISQSTREWVQAVVQQKKKDDKHGIPVPLNFAQIAPTYCGSPNDGYIGAEAVRRGNNQTDEFLSLLGLNHVITIPLNISIQTEQTVGIEEKDPDVIDIDDISNVCNKQL